MDPSRNWMAIVSLILGIISICGAGGTIVIPIIGLVLGFMGRSSEQGTLSTIGLVLNFLALFGWLIFLIFFGGLAVVASLAGVSGM